MYLESIYSSQKSFSKKAEVITEGAETKLKSYHTIVAVKQGKEKLYSNNITITVYEIIETSL